MGTVRERCEISETKHRQPQAAASDRKRSSYPSTETPAIARCALPWSPRCTVAGGAAA